MSQLDLNKMYEFQLEGLEVKLLEQKIQMKLMNKQLAELETKMKQILRGERKENGI